MLAIGLDHRDGRPSRPVRLSSRPGGLLTLRRPVQVVNLNRAPVDLIHRIFRDGRILLDGDRSARIAFEVKKRNEYFDLLPILGRYRRLAISFVTDSELVAKKLARIETNVREIRCLAKPAEISTDVREERFAEHTLAGALDVASHI